MTDPEKRIAALVSTVPTVPLTRRQRVFRVAAGFFALVASVALVLSIVSIYGLAEVGSCTNTNLGTRSAPTASDAKAHIAWAEAIEALFLPPNATQAQRAAAAESFRVATITYVTKLQVNQATRDAHPLGRC